MKSFGLRLSLRSSVEIRAETLRLTPRITPTTDLKAVYNSKRRHGPVESDTAEVDSSFEDEFEYMTKRLFKTPKLYRLEGQFSSALLPGNECKNRYKDILPFEKRRVVLTGSGEDTGDEMDAEAPDHHRGKSHTGYSGHDGYINASWVKRTASYPIPYEYIATQAPLPKTVETFWDMVWETGATNIVCLNRNEEIKQRRCSVYWPDEIGGTCFTSRRLKICRISDERNSEWEAQSGMFSMLDGKDRRRVRTTSSDMDVEGRLGGDRHRHGKREKLAFTPLRHSDGWVGGKGGDSSSPPCSHSRSKGFRGFPTLRRSHPDDTFGSSTKEPLSDSASTSTTRVDSTVEMDVRSDEMQSGEDGWAQGDDEDIPVFHLGESDVEMLPPSAKWFTHRLFQIENKVTGEVRNVHQWHFARWRDHSIPRKIDKLLDFALAVTSTASKDSPIIVHCSAGSGRTGTFIALHSIMMQWREYEEERRCTTEGVESPSFAFNVFEFVRFLRQCRIGMVESAEQYEFIYAALVQDLDRNAPRG
eukprot:TRINITY_DN1191_c0_g1_i3.p1 TRINITY_DN1191_c0_g1~~TRINITY_DN1191_c0_g1_i3.p1  ORF type:complete len:530 (-),score=146.75 TRINITY_DN1191_c0_g1_i3:1090-2679(-)